MCFFSEMRERMYTLAYKVEAFWIPLTIQGFELKAPLDKKLVHKLQLFFEDPVLVDNLNGPNEFAEVVLVWCRENVGEDTRPQAIQIVRTSGT